MCANRLTRRLITHFRSLPHFDIPRLAHSRIIAKPNPIQSSPLCNLSASISIYCCNSIHSYHLLCTHSRFHKSNIVLTFCSFVGQIYTGLVDAKLSATRSLHVCTVQYIYFPCHFVILPTVARCLVHSA